MYVSTQSKDVHSDNLSLVPFILVTAHKPPARSKKLPVEKDDFSEANQ